MTVFAKSILRNLGRAVAYQSPRGGDPVTIRAVITDVDQSLRPAGNSIIGGDASGSVDAAVRPLRGGILTTRNGAQYEIYGVIAAAVPGLLELELVRLNEKSVDPLFDFSKPVLSKMGETVIIDGNPVRVSVNRRGVFETVDEQGARIEIFKIVIAYKDADHPEIKIGSIVEIDGEEREITQILSEGNGLSKAVL